MAIDAIYPETAADEASLVIIDNLLLRTDRRAQQQTANKKKRPSHYGNALFRKF